MRWLPLVLVALSAVLGVGLRTWLQRRRTGAWGLAVFRDRRPAHLARELAFVAIGAAVAVQAALAAFGARTVAPGGTLWILAGVPVSGLLLMCVAQLQLGRAWRIGIDWSARPGLVTHGLYGWSRNPIFVGLLTILFGNALLLPTVTSWVAFVAAMVVIRAQVLTEESYLLEAYGDSYREYARRVGRFIPFLGRLR